ncbi:MULTISPECIES: acyl carrier protein [Streptomyces]|uniref:acyl carrier protein n=1 Tax=Streptomyces TaxID=1883 RepID=UPI003D704AF7
MSEDTPVVRELRELPVSERREALESLVCREFKATLLMTEAEELPLDRNYFSLGFTSLRITEIKQRLEVLLGRSISASVLFDRPTVAQLLDHLCDETLGEFFDGSARGHEDAPELKSHRAMWEEVLADLYRG